MHPVKSAGRSIAEWAAAGILYVLLLVTLGSLGNCVWVWAGEPSPWDLEYSHDSYTGPQKVLSVGKVVPSTFVFTLDYLKKTGGHLSVIIEGETTMPLTVDCIYRPKRTVIVVRKDG